MKERKRMDKNQDTIEHYLDDVVIALNQRHANQEMEIKGEYNSIKEEVRNKVIKKINLIKKNNLIKNAKWIWKIIRRRRAIDSIQNSSGHVGN